MLKNVSLGTFHPNASLLHRLQARTKLFLFVWLICWLMIANHRKWHFVPFVVAFVLLALSLYFSKISPRILWQRMWLLVVLTLIGVWPILGTNTGVYRVVATLGPLSLPYQTVMSLLLGIGCFCAVLVASFYLPWSVWRTFWRHRRVRLVRGLAWALLPMSFCLFLLLRGLPGNQLLPIGPLILTDAGLWIFLTASSFLLLLLAFSLILTMTTSPVALIEGVNIILEPLRRLRLPVDSFALMALLALRFIPTLLEETEQLSKAQTARGADMTSGTWRERFQSLIMLFVPLMHAVLRQASELATALEARGYQADGKHTTLYENAFRTYDYTVMVSVLLLTLLALVF